MSTWLTVEVDQVCNLIVDCVNKTAPVIQEKTLYRMIRTTNIRNGRINLNECRFVTEETYRKWTRRAKLEYGDVLLTREAPIGEVGFVIEPEGLFLGQRIMQYRANTQVLIPRYLHYSFLSPSLKHQFGSHEGSGSVVSHIRVGDCFKFKLFLPPLLVQQKIVDILGTIDDKIALNREMNKTLEAMAQAIFKSWFVDFEPFKESEFIESELGMIPKGWEVKSLGNICSFVKGCSYKGNGLSEDDGAYMFNLGCFNAPRVHATEKIKRYVGEYRERHSVKQGDLILANTDMTQERAILGRPLIIPKGYEPGFISHHVYKVELSHNIRQDIVPFLFFLFLEDRFREKMVGSATGSVVLALPRDVLEQYNLLIPNDDILDKFLSIVQPMLANIEEHIKQSQTLSTLRDTLLPKLLSGEIEV